MSVMRLSTSHLPSQSSDAPFLLESLEQRIAPAVMINAGGVGGTPAAESVNYTDAQSPGGSTPFELASAFPDADISGLFTGSTDHYFLELNAKDTLNIWNTVGGFSSFAAVTSGKAYAFFFDVNGDEIVQSNEMTGLMIAGGTSMNVFGSVYGDILTTVNGKTGDVSLNLGDANQSIKNLTVEGSVGGLIDGNMVSGSILAGGAITNLTVGQVTTIGTGNAGDGYNFDIGGGTAYGQGALGAITMVAKKAGPNITSVTAGSVGSILAGDGGESAAGGSISKITVLNDTNGFLIQAGDGGSGLSGNNKGGAGGKISDVVVHGVEDATFGDQISIVGGNGGAGFGTGVGGVGGTVEKLYVGYQYSGTKLEKSQVFLHDYVSVLGGDGGTGKSGGNGGLLKTINLRVDPDGDVDPAIILDAGSGGNANTATGKGGNGGSVDSYYILNNYAAGQSGVPMDPISQVHVFGGNGGGNGATGGNGGAVTNGIVLSKGLEISGGNGGDGSKKAGNGGALTSLQIAYPGDSVLTQFGQFESNVAPIWAQEVLVRAGSGGNSSAGTGGNGGNLTKVSAPDTDLAVLQVNFASGGNGGMGGGGNGGNGGTVTDVHFDSDRVSVNDVSALLRSGDGGMGTKKGGNGGEFSNSSFLLTNADITATTGVGGSGASGGNGGAIKALTTTTIYDVAGAPGTIVVTTGDGGAAATNGKGGTGGSITGIGAQAYGDVTVTAGDGGATVTGTSGNGGSVSNAVLLANDATYAYVTVFTRSYDPNNPSDPYGDYFPTQFPTDPTTSSAVLTAGNGGGGTTPAKGGNGGAISNANVTGLLNVSIAAGNGTFGGVGGDIKGSSAYGATVLLSDVFQSENTVTSEIYTDSTANSFSEAAFGDVVIAAGNGGDGPKTGGKGGSLIDVNGFSSFSTGTGLFTAGNGGIGATGNGGAGGLISKLSIDSGNSEYSVLAGNGGNSAGTGAGGNGGNVTEFFGSPDVMVRSLSAGNGGDSTMGKKGGNGGSVSKINVEGDIGQRFGANYGFGIGMTAMGGIFAGGAGEGLGAGGTLGKTGTVLDVTASAIASIVAGTSAMPELAAKVDNIFLRGNTTLAANPNGSFNVVGGTVDPVYNTTTNLFNAVFVGGFSGDPTMANADQFKVNGGGPLTAAETVWQPGWTPLDGLIAAEVLGPKATGNAWLTNNSSGQLVLVSRFNS